MSNDKLQEEVGFHTFIDNSPKEVGTYSVVLDNGIVHDMRFIPGEVSYPGKWEWNGLNFTSRVICWRKVSDGEDLSEECVTTPENDSET